MFPSHDRRGNLELDFIDDSGDVIESPITITTDPTIDNEHIGSVAFGKMSDGTEIVVVAYEQDTSGKIFLYIRETDASTRSFLTSKLEFDTGITGTQPHIAQIDGDNWALCYTNGSDVLKGQSISITK